MGSHGTWIVWVWSYTKNTFFDGFLVSVSRGLESWCQALKNVEVKMVPMIKQAAVSVVCFIKENGQRGVIVGKKTLGVGRCCFFCCSYFLIYTL